MEKRKRIFLLEPIQQKSISKYGRKTSKFIFKLRNEPKPCEDDDSEYINLKSSQNFAKKDSEMYGNTENNPSIILCQTNCLVEDEAFEKKINIGYPPVSNIKNIEINSNYRKILKIEESDQSPSVQKHNGGKCGIVPSQSIITNVPSKTISFKRIKNEKFISNGRKRKFNKDCLTFKNETFEKTETKMKVTSNQISCLRKQVKKNISKKTFEENLSEESKSLNTESKMKNKALNITGNSPNKLENDVQKIVNEKVAEEEIRLKAENERLLTVLKELKTKVEKASEVQSYQRERITLSKLRLNQEMLYYYVGFKDPSLITNMTEGLTEYFLKHGNSSSEILIEDQLLMTLMKLRRNYSLHDLAFRFRVPLADSYNIIFNVIQGLHYTYYEQGLNCKQFPSIEDIQAYLPEQFINFPNCRVVLESFKVGCEDPSYEFGSNVFVPSKFDPKIILKGVIGISPTKQVVFCSGLYEGTTSNADISKDCHILDKLSSGDLIMADKSFDEILKFLPSDIDLNTCSATKSLLTDKQIKHLNSKARAFIGRTTMQHLRRFSVLNHIPTFLSSIAVKVFQLCATLVNFQPTICSLNEVPLSDQ